MWVHFGFGKIGKGAISQFLKKTQLDNYLIVDRKTTSKIQESIILRNESESKIINGVKLTPFRLIDKKGVRVISTSVTVKAIPSLIENISEILREAKDVVAIVPFENDPEAMRIINRGLKEYKEKFIVLESMIDMIVSMATGNEVYGEMLPKILIDERINNYLENKLPDWFLSKNISRDHLQKFYFVNGIHAAIAYLGLYWGGFNFIDEVVNSTEWEAIEPEVIELFSSFDYKEFKIKHSFAEEYCRSSIERFSTRLDDPLLRVARDPRRKTNKADRMAPLFGTRIWDKIIEGSRSKLIKYN